MRSTIGIVGGMGPLATVDFLKHIIENTAVDSEQEHMHVLVDCDPAIPSRKEAILGKGISPEAYLVNMAQRLEDAGASILAMPCHTAHYYHSAIASSVSVPVLNMPEKTVAQIKKMNINRVCLLATDMVLQTGIYHDAFAQASIQYYLPSLDAQNEMMRAIFLGIKTRKKTFDCPLLKVEMKRMIEQMDVELFLLACTELPLLFRELNIVIPILDPTLLLSRIAVRMAGGKLTEPTDDIYHISSE